MVCGAARTNPLGKYRMRARFGIVDLFAGPGGLAEGFSAVREGDQPTYSVIASIEKEASAHATLRFRAFLRQFPDEDVPGLLERVDRNLHLGIERASQGIDASRWRNAQREAVLAELGTPKGDAAVREVFERARQARRHHDDLVVIGGPPCQAYSLVGRARNAGKTDYVPEEDDRHFLYAQYISVLAGLKPAAFVMENVKGILSSTIHGRRIFRTILHDLRNSAGPDSYRLFALMPRSLQGIPHLEPDSEDFIVRAEDCGVPQARHRVIVVGIRSDIAGRLSREQLPVLPSTDCVASVCDGLTGLPPLRSGVSRSTDDPHQWRTTVIDQAARALKAVGSLRAVDTAAVQREMRDAIDRLHAMDELPRTATDWTSFPTDNRGLQVQEWFARARPSRIWNHESRSHMESDFGRYFYAASFGKAHGRSPKGREFPDVLAPNHRNWGSGKFDDRFRVQVCDRPATTVTSHISKDGHYFIHPDPAQCRSLTVREAARLQTFPDNYIFLGNRTQQ